MMARSRLLAIVLAILAVPVAIALVEAAKSAASDHTNGSMVSAGVERRYLLYVPRSYDRAKPAPLVISIHGAGAWPAQQMDTSQWNTIADREGLIVVYPAGVDGRGPRIWRVGDDPELALDVTFIRNLIDRLAASYNIDRRRIYANGLSNGGGMSFVLSCELPDRIAAVGLVATAQTMAWEGCRDQRPVPMISFHGDADTHTPFHGGTSWISPRAFPSQVQWTANWARRNRCGESSSDVRLAVDVVRRAYSRCANGADVTLYVIEGGGHTWPGGGHLPRWALGRTTHSIDATELMWEFFRAHPLQQPPVER